MHRLTTTVTSSIARIRGLRRTRVRPARSWRATEIGAVLLRGAAYLGGGTVESSTSETHSSVPIAKKPAPSPTLSMRAPPTRLPTMTDVDCAVASMVIAGAASRGPAVSKISGRCTVMFARPPTPSRNMNGNAIQTCTCPL